MNQADANHSDVFDAAMVVVATYALNIFNPGMLLYARRSERAEDFELDKSHP